MERQRFPGTAITLTHLRRLHRTAFRVVLFAVVLLVLTSCRSDERGKAEKSNAVFVTLPALASIVAEISAPVLSVESVLEAGQSAHTFEPLPSVVRRASRAALLVFAADHLDDWALHVPGVQSLSLISLLPDSLKLRVSGDHHSIDPHFWTDPVAVRAILGPLAAELCDIAPDGCSRFRDNADRFGAKLDSLDRRTALELESVRGERFAFTHSFLRYFFARYDLEADNVIGGDETFDASPRRIARLVTAARDKHVTALLVEDRVSMTAPRVVAAEINVPLVILDIVGEYPTASYIDLIENLSGRLVSSARESKRH